MERVNTNLFGQSEQQYDPSLLAKMKANTYNKEAGDLSGSDCHKCLNKGSVMFPRNDGTVYTMECDCMKVRRCLWEIERSGLTKAIQEKTFATYSAVDPWQMTMKKLAMEYADRLNGWLLFCGQSGSGKTHLCTAVLSQRLQSGDEGRYMLWTNKVAELKGLALDAEKRDEAITAYKGAQILYIDDLYKVGKSADGSSTPTRADIGLTFEIINHRYINALPTIISTEKTPQELVEIDEATGSRIIEMAKDNTCVIAYDIRRNYRLQGMMKG